MISPLSLLAISSACSLEGCLVSMARSFSSLTWQTSEVPVRGKTRRIDQHAGSNHPTSVVSLPASMTQRTNFESRRNNENDCGHDRRSTIVPKHVRTDPVRCDAYRRSCTVRDRDRVTASEIDGTACHPLHSNCGEIRIVRCNNESFTYRGMYRWRMLLNRA